MTTPQPAALSPAARSVLDAYQAAPIVGIHPQDADRLAVAAAIRSVADLVVPDEQRPPRRGVRPGGTGALTPEEGAEDQRAVTRRHLIRIATDLEGGHDGR